MRGTHGLAAVLLLAAVAACTPDVERRDGRAGPAGSPPATATATASPGRAGSAAPTARPTEPTAPRGRTSEIRRTDWPNVTIENLAVCGDRNGVARFRDGSNGYDVPCRMLPGGARPAYAEFLVEEPANRPATEDALVLVELGNPGAARQQFLVPVAISYDGRTRTAWPVIAGDDPSPTGDTMMRFRSYRVDGQVVVARVELPDGRVETRRYRQAGMFGPWERF